MPTLNNSVRTQLLDLIRNELEMVNGRAETVAEHYWQEAEYEVAKNLGYGDTLLRIEHIKNQIQGLQNELAHLEGGVRERGQLATADDFKELGIQVNVNQYGKLYSYPHIFNREIKTLWDVAVLKHINATLPFLKIYTGLSQLHHVVKRELLLCGSFVDARALYQRFHEKVRDALGTEVPGLLSDVTSLPALQSPEEM